MRIESLRTLATLTLFVSWSAATMAAEPAPGQSLRAVDYLHITAVAPGYASNGRWVVFLAGYIDTGATARLTHLLDKEQISSALVYFDSPGGHVVEAMALGRLLRNRDFSTSVGARAPDSAVPRVGRCFSACPIAYAGGVHRSLVPGSVLGIHRAENSVPVADESAFQQVVAGQVSDYLTGMGIGGKLVTIMSEVPNDSIRELSFDEAVKLGLVNADAAGNEMPTSQATSSQR